MVLAPFAGGDLLPSSQGARCDVLGSTTQSMILSLSCVCVAACSLCQRCWRSPAKTAHTTPTRTPCYCGSSTCWACREAAGGAAACICMCNVEQQRPSAQAAHVMWEPPGAQQRVGAQQRAAGCCCQFNVCCQPLCSACWHLAPNSSCLGFVPQSVLWSTAVTRGSACSSWARYVWSCSCVCDCRRRSTPLRTA